MTIFEDTMDLPWLPQRRQATRHCTDTMIHTTLGDYYVFIFLRSEKTRLYLFYLTWIILYNIFIVKYNIIYSKDIFSIDFSVRRSMRRILNNKKKINKTFLLTLESRPRTLTRLVVFVKFS